MPQHVIYVNDLAAMLGTSEAAVRSSIQRKGWPGSIPPPFRIGRKWAWQISAVTEWLNSKALAGPSKMKKRGRPLKTSTVVCG